MPRRAHLRATRTGIGTALREARQSKGISLQKASRETRIHSDYLNALERESYEALRADVYVRGFLRSYSSYLGLDADKVITVYERRVKPAPAAAPASVPEMTKRGLGLPRRGASWKLAVGLAVVLLAVFGAVGLLTASGRAPQPGGGLPSAQRRPAAPPEQVTVKLSPIHVTYARVVADGVRKFSGVLPLGKQQSFTAQSLVRVELNHGGAVDVMVNGHDLGRIGDPKAPYQASFAPQDFGGVGSSPSAGTGSGS
jgi:transcriptional regulator with XRE-family HTH domain